MNSTNFKFFFLYNGLNLYFKEFFETTIKSACITFVAGGLTGAGGFGLGAALGVAGGPLGAIIGGVIGLVFGGIISFFCCKDIT